MQTLDSKPLRILLAVVRHGSIRSAAEAMQIAPSVVSRQIAETERNVGLALFDRSSRGVGLTEAGTLVVEHARRVLEDADLLSEQVGALRGIQQRRVRILTGEGFLADLVETGLGSFSAIYPDIRYTLELGNTDRVMDAVANSDADIGVAYNPVLDTRARSLAISRQPLCLVAPAGHPLLARRDLAFSDCLAGRYALLTRNHGVAQLVSRVATEGNVALDPLVETPSIDALRRFVMAGLGVTFLPRSAVATQAARGALGVAELTDPLLVQATAHLMVKARRRLPTSVERMANWLCDAMATFKS